MAKGILWSPGNVVYSQSSACCYWIVIASRPFQWTELQMFFELCHLYVVVCVLC